jgi:hypothetical protein
MKLLVLIVCSFLFIISCSSPDNRGKSSKDEGQETRIIYGTITDARNNPLEKSIIVVSKPQMDKPLATISDFSGKFILEIPEEVTEITVSHPGKYAMIVNVNENEEYKVILQDEE